MIAGARDLRNSLRTCALEGRVASSAARLTRDAAGAIIATGNDAGKLSSPVDIPTCARNRRRRHSRNPIVIDTRSNDYKTAGRGPPAAGRSHDLRGRCSSTTAVSRRPRQLGRGSVIVPRRAALLYGRATRRATLIDTDFFVRRSRRAAALAIRP